MRAKKKTSNKMDHMNKKGLYNAIYTYRFDIFALIVMLSVMMYYVEVLLRPGQIVFSDIDFAYKSTTYMDEVFGIWNTKWNTTSMLNIPRLLVLLPSFLFSKLANNNGDLFLKSFLVQNLVTAGLSFYVFAKRLVSLNISRHFTMGRIVVIIFGSLYYALNPWVIFRIQHIYLLVGYSLFPLVILLFFKIFDHKFQEVAIFQYDFTSGRLYKKNIRDIILLAYVITISAAAIHYFFYTAILLSMLLGLLIVKYMIKYRYLDKKQKKNMWMAFGKKILLLGIFLLGFSFYWLVVYFGSILFGVEASQNNVNVVDTYVAFSRNSSFKEVLFFISYWWPMIDLRQLSVWFYIGGGLVIGIASIGVLYNVIKQQIILFFVILSSMLIIISTGVHYPALAKLFLTVTNLPIIGSIFRDPNKLVGLLAMCIGVFFVFGLESLLLKLTNIIGNKYVASTLVIGIGALALMAYILPFKTLYFEHFYAPVEEPSSYSELRAYYEGNTDHYGVFFPLSDEMTMSGAHVSTPYWNVNPSGSNDVTKATGDIQIYNSPITTLFQFEGNDPAIAYYFNYIQYLMDEGRSNKIGENIKAFGVDQFLYHNEYKAQESRQDFNLDVIALDQGLEKQYENDIFSVYVVGHTLTERDTNMSLVHDVIMTPYGYERTAIYESAGFYDPLKEPIVYLNQYTNTSEGLKDLNGQTSIIEAKNAYDLVMSQLPEKYYAYPFDWTNKGNPFIGWSKTYLTAVDWSWYLSSQGMVNKAFEFDRGRGMAVTFASKQLALEPYLRDTVKGKLVLDFDTMLRTDTFFTPDNPDMFEINSNPYSDLKDVQTLRGELIKGDPKNIWQVAKSGILPANAGTPYYFELVLSGRDVDKLHLKVRFYDKSNEEIGVSYIVAANEESYFDSIKFTGEVVSPLNTAHMRIDLLSYQNPAYKSYWWIHEVNVYDLSQYAKTNGITSEISVEEKGTYDVFVRNFDSNKGGLLKLNIGEASFEWSTKDETMNKLNWHALGNVELEAGASQIELVGLDGFNAINSVVVIPYEAYLSYEKQVVDQIKDNKVLMTFESSLDLSYEGNIQSERLDPSLSLGRGVALVDGRLFGEFDVMCDDSYEFYPAIKYINEKDGYGILTIFKEGKLIKSWSLNERQKKEQREYLVEYTPHNETYPYQFIDMTTPYQFVDSGSYTIALEKGHYTFEINLHSQTDSMSSIEYLTPFDTSTVQFEMTPNDPDFVASCERITLDMMHQSVDQEGLHITFDPTCSTDWYSYATQKMDVSVDEEYLIRFEAKSENLKNRHSKVLFLDERDKVLGETYINEVEAQYKVQWNHYEQLVKVPAGSKQMLIQFLGNGDRELISSLDIQDFEVFNDSTFITLDHLMVKNKWTSDLESIKTTSNLSRKLNQFGLKYEFESGESIALLNTFISPNKNWVHDGSKSSYSLNGITQGFEYDGSTQYDIGLLLMPYYMLGLIIHLLSITVGTLLYMKIKN